MGMVLSIIQSYHMHKNYNLSKLKEKEQPEWIEMYDIIQNKKSRSNYIWETQCPNFVKHSLIL
jgi:hypothetical protein